jgi:hypothetical protein
MGSYGGLGGALPFLNQAITCSGLSFGMALAPGLVDRRREC